MTLELIILLIILIPIAFLVLLRSRKEPRMGIPALLCRIGGIFLLVFGLLLLFPAFYLLFHGKGGGMDVPLLILTLAMIATGYWVTNRCGNKEKIK